MDITFSNAVPNAEVCHLNYDWKERKISFATIGARSYLVKGHFDAGSERAHLLMGRYCSISHDVTFVVGLNHHFREVSSYPFDDFENIFVTHRDDENCHAYSSNHYQVIIGNDVWIGEHVIVLGGVRIGNGAVIGAGAVVSKNVPPYAVVVGNPARVVKYRFSKEIIEKLERIQWWNWDHETVLARRQELKNPATFVQRYDVPLLPVKDAASEIIRKVQAGGGRVFEFVLDFDAEVSLWDKVLDAYLSEVSPDEHNLLLLELPAALQTHPAAQVFRQRMAEMDASKPSVGHRVAAKIPALDTLPFVDAFITNRKEESSQCIDIAEVFDVTVLSGCDYGSGLFQRGKQILSKKQEKIRVPWDVPEEEHWRVRTHRVYADEKAGIDQMLHHGDFEAAAERLGFLVNLMYLANETFVDDFVEERLATLADHVEVAVPAETEHGCVLFYDAFGLDMRGLAVIYVRALVQLGYHLVYCVEEGHAPLPHIEEILRAGGGEIAELQSRGKGHLARCRALCDVIAQHAPEAAFLYTSPYDLGGILAFHKMAGKTKRIKLNLTDHAFWPGRDSFDICQEFRDFGAKISREERKLPAGKLLKQCYYPNIDKSIPFEGYPFQREPGDIVIFSGGSIYKTQDAKKTYYHLVDDILQAHPNVKFWYAGTGVKDGFIWLQQRHPGRVFLTPERKDLYQVLLACDLYLNTYPFIGALMTQYAAAAGCLPLTYSEIPEPLRDLLKQVDELDVVRHDKDSFLALVAELIEHPEERERRGKLAKTLVVTEEEFRENLDCILRTGTSAYPIQDKDIVMETSFVQQVSWTNFLQVCGDTIKKMAGEA